MTQHARTPRQNILNGVVKDVPQGQNSRDIRRRDDDRVGGLDRMRIRLKDAIVQPTLIPFRLDRPRIVCFWKLAHGAPNHPETRHDCKMKR